MSDGGGGGDAVAVAVAVARGDDATALNASPSSSAFWVSCQQNVVGKAFFAPVSLSLSLSLAFPSSPFDSPPC